MESGNTRSTIAKAIKLRRQRITIREFEDWRHTEEYVELCARAEGWNGKAFSRCVANEKARCVRVWEQALASMRNITDDEKEAMKLAEQALVQTKHTPPHWTCVLTCEQCGTMPAPRTHRFAHVVACPWCTGEMIFDACTERAV